VAHCSSFETSKDLFEIVVGGLLQDAISGPILFIASLVSSNFKLVALG
jgi:hypothetical protein